MVFVLTAFVGGLGAAARFALDTALTHRLAESWLRLMAINVSGSALLGLLTGLAATGLLSPDLQLILGAGFLGGYTTFSTASLATVQLAGEQRATGTVLSSVGMLIASTVAAALGLIVGLTR